MNAKRMVKWIIVLFLLAALPGMTAVLAQDGGEPPPIIILEPPLDSNAVPAEIPAGTDEATAATTIRVSVSSAGVQGNNTSDYPDISDDGRLVAFASLATNLVPGDTNGQWDVFVRDLQTNTTTRVSVNSAGVQGNGRSEAPVLSADGRFVVFGSYARNLVAGDTNGKRDVFVHDRNTGQTTRVSVSSTGAQANGMSMSYAVSADGRFVTFQSVATNLVAGDTNGKEDVFLHDRQTAVTTRISTGAPLDGQSWAPDISADGRFVVFVNNAMQECGDMTWSYPFVYDRLNARVDFLDPTCNVWYTDNPVISASGSYVAYQAGYYTGSSWNEAVFAYDRQNNTELQISVSTSGVVGNADSYSPSISSSGRYVAFESLATNLVPGDGNNKEDVFLRDRQQQTTTRVSVNTTGAQGNNWSHWAAITGDGKKVVFSSLANNLVTGDTNGKADVFVRDFGGTMPPPTAAKILALGDSITFGYAHMSPDYPLGDPNVDGLVNNADLTVYTNWLANPSTIPPVTSEAFKRGDADTNGSITAADKDIAYRMVIGYYTRAFRGHVVADKTRASYRLPLYQLFSRQTNYTLSFVGTVDTEKTYNFTGYPAASASYPRPTAAQIAFVGQPGKTTADVNTGTNALFGLKPALTQLKSQNKVPDVVLIHLGTNDINKSLTWTTTQKQLNDILAKLRNGAAGGNPAMKIYIAEIIPVGDLHEACKTNVTFAANCPPFWWSGGLDETVIEEFNRHLQSMCGWNESALVESCANLSTANSPVYLVSQDYGFDMENWLISSDEVHPNRQGECRIALRWYEALRATEFPNLPAPAADFCNPYNQS